MNYKIEDWLTGKVVLEDTYCSTPAHFSRPNIVKLDDFCIEDVAHILKEQQNMFYELCDKYFNEIQIAIKRQIGNSRYINKFIFDEKQKLENILFDKQVLDNSKESHSWKFLFNDSAPTNYCIETIQSYISNNFIQGLEPNYQFMCSIRQHHHYDPKDYIPEVIAETLHRIYEWLQNYEADIQCHFDSTLWNEDCFQLFFYLDNNFGYTDVKTKYRLLWHFLNDLNLKTELPYLFKMKKEKYFNFIKDNVNSNFVSEDGKQPAMNPPNGTKQSLAIKNLEKMTENYSKMRG
jgi:hypothetical protein